MTKRVVAQEGKIELIVADGASDIDIGADGTLAGSVNVGQRVGVDNNGNVTVTDSSDTYSWTLEPQASWIELTASNPGASEYGFYFEVGGEVGQYDVAVAAPSQPPVVADGAFDARFNIWSQNNPISYELANFGFNGSADLEIYNGIRGGNMLLYTFNDGGTFKQITFDPDAEAFRLEDGLSLFIQEQATANASVATYGQVWVQTGTPNTLIFTDDAGTDVVIGSAAATVNATGTPADNQVAVWTGTNTLEGDANFTWTGTTLAIAGAGAQLLLPFENDDATPTLAFGDGDTGFFENIDDTLRLSHIGVERWQWTSTGFTSLATSGPQMRHETPSDTNPVFVFLADEDTGVGRQGADALSLIAGGVEMIRAVETGVATTDQVIISPGATLRGTAATPLLAFGDGDTGFYESADDTLVISLGTTAQWDFASSAFQGTQASRPALQNEVASTSNPTLIPHKAAADTGIGGDGADILSFIAGGVEIGRVDQANDRFVTNAPLFVQEQAAAGADVADYGQLWVRSDAPNTLMYTDDTGNDFTANNVLEIEYAYSSATAVADPGAGTLRFDTITIGSITEMYIDDLDNTGRDNSIMLANLAKGDLITFRSATDSADYIIATVTSAPTDNTGYWTVPLTLIHTGTIFTNGDLMRLSVEWLSQASSDLVNAGATVQTTDATVTEIISVPVASGTGFGFRVNVFGLETATGDAVYVSAFGALRNFGGTTSFAGTVVTDRTDTSGASAWAITITADDTTDALTVDVTGEAAHTIDWKVNVERLEV